MIAELDETIKQLITKKGNLDHGEIDIKFETPNRDWSASLSKPTINLYLYDIRENHELRSTEWMIEKTGNNTATKRKNARRIDLSYLVTVWSNNIEDQHGLLWMVLATLIRYPIIPKEILIGHLGKQDYPILTHTAQPDGLFSNPADFWAALDNEIKPSFNYVVTLPMDPEIAFTSAITRTSSFSFAMPDTEAESILSISGIVHLKDHPEKGIPGVTLVAKEANLSAVTDEKGKYSFAGLSSGKQTLQVVVANEKQKTITLTIPGINYDIAL
jgi:hypothetical protein